MTANVKTILHMKDIVKAFDGVRALDPVDFDSELSLTACRTGMGPFSGVSRDSDRGLADAALKVLRLIKPLAFLLLS